MLVISTRIVAREAGHAAVMPCVGWAGSNYGNRRINSEERLENEIGGEILGLNHEKNGNMNSINII